MRKRAEDWWRVEWNSRSLHCAPPDFLLNLKASVHFMRPSLRKGTYAACSLLRGRKSGYAPVGMPARNKHANAESRSPTPLRFGPTASRDGRDDTSLAQRRVVAERREIGWVSDLRGLGCLGFYCFDLCVESVAAQKVGQVLRESGARHHHVTAGLHGLRLQVTLQMREETNH
jgi:hypothetical protein